MNVFPPGGEPIDPTLKPIEKIKPDKEFEKIKPDKEVKLEKREKEKLEKEGKLEKEKREKEKLEKEGKSEIKEIKPEIKEAKPEKETDKAFKEIKQEKLEKLEHKEKLEKLEQKEISKLEDPEKQIGEIGGKEIAETPGPGQAVSPALDPNTLMQHAQNLEQTGRQLRHFIEQSLRPDLSTGALRGEEDVRRDEETEEDSS